MRQFLANVHAVSVERPHHGVKHQAVAGAHVCALATEAAAYNRAVGRAGIGTIETGQLARELGQNHPCAVFEVSGIGFGRLLSHTANHTVVGNAMAIAGEINFGVGFISKVVVRAGSHIVDVNGRFLICHEPLAVRRAVVVSHALIHVAHFGSLLRVSHSAAQQHASQRE